MAGKIFLLAESDYDRLLVQALLKANGYNISVEVRGEARGLSRLIDNRRGQFDRIIRTALEDARLHGRACVVILHDWDVHTEGRRALYDQVASIEKQYSPVLKRVIARDQIEAWLLADSGICEWLGISKARSWDEQPGAKEEIERRLRDKRLKYNDQGHRELIRHLHGDGHKHSKSLSYALALLIDAPCTRP